MDMIGSNLLHPIQVQTPEVSLGGPLSAPPRKSQTCDKALLATSAMHFSNILKYLTIQKEEGRRSLTSIVPDMDSGFQSSGGRWGDISIPSFDILSVPI